MAAAKTETNGEYDFSNIRMKPDQVTVVISHGTTCTDGRAAAFAAWLRLGTKAKYYFQGHIPSTDGRKPLSPEIPIKGEYVVFLDYCCDAETMKMVEKESADFVVIDHHVTAMTDLKDFKKENIAFCMNHCGSYGAWKWFHPGKPLPKFFGYIEEGDLFRFVTPESKEFLAYVNNANEKFTDFNRYMDEKVVAQTIMEGGGMLKFIIWQVDNALRSSALKMMTLGGKEYLVAYVNGTHYKSEIGNALIRKYPEADFSVVHSYNDAADKSHFSLRSENKRQSVADIAKLYPGGGGHRNASGLSLFGLHTTLPVDAKTESLILRKSYSADSKFSMSTMNCSIFPEKALAFIVSKNISPITLVWYYNRAENCYVSTMHVAPGHEVTLSKNVITSSRTFTGNIQLKTRVEPKFDTIIAGVSIDSTISSSDSKNEQSPGVKILQEPL